MSTCVSCGCKFHDLDYFGLFFFMFLEKNHFTLEVITIYLIFNIYLFVGFINAIQSCHILYKLLTITCLI